MSFVVVLYHIFSSNTKTIKIPTKLDADSTDAAMGLDDNEQEPYNTIQLRTLGIIMFAT